MTGPVDSTKHYLVASDFDQTLSFHDSGRVLADLLGVSRFDEKVAGLARSNLVQQGGELAYLIRHDPEFRSVRVEVNGQNTSSSCPQRTPIAAQLTTPSDPVVVTTVSISGA